MEIEGRRRWTKEQKRQIVEETLKPDGSVSLVARAHDVNANQVFYWRRLYRQGLLRDEQPKAVSLVPGLLSIMLCLIGSYGTLESGLKHRIELRQNSEDCAGTRSPAAVLE